MPDSSFALSATRRWDLGSLIDLEIAEARDKALLSADLNLRDREVSKAIRRAIANGQITAESRGAILHCWLESRRRDEGFTRISAGLSIWRAWSVLRMAGALGCTVFGATVAWGALNIRTVDEAVNVLIFWTLTALLPFLLTMTAFGFLLSGCRSKSSGGPVFWRDLLADMLIRGWERKLRASGMWDSCFKLADDLKMRLTARHGMLSAQMTGIIYLLGLCTVLGIWMATCSFELFSDQVYGWKSHASSMTTERVGKFVAKAAIPWSGIEGEGLGYPTAAQVEATRASPTNLRPAQDAPTRMAWISFLNWSVFTYGVLPRLALWIAGWIHIRKSLRAESFDAERFRELCLRLSRPTTTIIYDDDEPELTEERGREETAVIAAGSGLLLVPEEFAKEAVAERISEPVLQGLRVSFSVAVSLPMMPAEQEKCLTNLAAQMKPSPEAVYLVQEAFMPPTRACMDVIDRLRRAFGPSMPIRVILTCELSTAAAGPMPDDRDLAVWAGELHARADPYLSKLAIELPPSR